MSFDSQPAVRRIRRVSGSPAVTQLPPQEGSYGGFGSVPGETLDRFHDRMYGIDALAATLYEFELELHNCPDPVVQINHEEEE